MRQFNDYEEQAKRLLAVEDTSLALPAYELVLKAGHTFNLLDARGAISVTERATYIGRIRALSRIVAQNSLKAARNWASRYLKTNKSAHTYHAALDTFKWRRFYFQTALTSMPSQHFQPAFR